MTVSHQVNGKDWISTQPTVFGREKNTSPMNGCGYQKWIREASPNNEQIAIWLLWVQDTSNALIMQDPYPSNTPSKIPIEQMRCT